MFGNGKVKTYTVAMVQGSPVLSEFIHYELRISFQLQKIWLQETCTDYNVMYIDSCVLLFAM